MTTLEAWNYRLLYSFDYCVLSRSNGPHGNHHPIKSAHLQPYEHRVLGTRDGDAKVLGGFSSPIDPVGWELPALPRRQLHELEDAGFLSAESLHCGARRFFSCGALPTRPSMSLDPARESKNILMHGAECMLRL